MGVGGKQRRAAGMRTARWEEAGLLFAVPLALIVSAVVGVGALLPALPPGGAPAPRAVVASALLAPDATAPSMIALLPDGTAAPTPLDAPLAIARTDALPEVQHSAAAPQLTASTAAPTATIPAVASETDTPPLRITAVGDSVMLGAAVELTRQIPNMEVDAAVSRQVATAVDILRRLRDTDKLGDVVVLHIGNNGTFTEAQFDQVMAVLGADRRVVFLNLKEPRNWEGPNNAVIAAGVARYPNATLVDWRGASIARTEYFGADEIHLTPAGARAYAALVRARLFPVRPEGCVETGCPQARNG